MRAGFRRVAGTLVAAASLAAGTLICTPGASADSLSNAKARAAALAREVHVLDNRAEIATQRYDAIEARLAGAVNGALTSDRKVEALHQQVSATQQQIYQRVQALYASAGDLGTFAQLLAGDAAGLASRAQITASVVNFQLQTVRRDQAMVQVAGGEASRRQLSAAQTIQLQTAAAKARASVVGLLAEERAKLQAASSTVRQLVAQQQQAAALASAQTFDSAVTAAGGSLDGGTRPPNAIVAAALAAARSRLGVPYVWGATGPDSFDCSGLTQWSYAHAGIALPRTAAQQWYSGPHPALSALEPGDLLFWATDLNDPATIHHVTIYIGNGLMIAAPHTGVNVQVQPVYMDGFFGATRPWAKAG